MHAAILAVSVGAEALAPDEIANLKAWFKGSDFDATSDGTDVATWTDSSGNSEDMTAVAGAADRPVVARNTINTNMTSVKGVNATNGLTDASFALSNPNIWTVFAVIKFLALPASTSHNIFFGFDDQLNLGMWMGIEDDGTFQITLPNVGTWRTNEALMANWWYYIVVRNVSGTISVYLNGALLTWASTTGTIGNTPASFGMFLTNSGNANRGNCLIPEFALFDAAVSDTSRIGLQHYASERFNL